MAFNQSFSRSQAAVPLLVVKLARKECTQLVPARPHTQEHAGLCIHRVDTCQDDEALLHANDRALHGGAVLQVCNLIAAGRVHK